LKKSSEKGQANERSMRLIDELRELPNYSRLGGAQEESKGTGSEQGRARQLRATSLI